MMIALFVILTALLILYIMALFYLRRGLLFQNHPIDQNRRLPSVSVIVPARNEAHHIKQLCACLQKQNYPTSFLEFCIVDDRSTDETFARIEAFAANCPQLKALQVFDTLPHMAPKKRAIDLGIRRSQGEIVMITDADTAPGPDWVRHFATRFADDVAMICGYSPYHPRESFWQKILALEYFSLAAVSAAGIGAGWPLTCTGSNLAYRRAAYYAIGGFEKIASFVSGDDDLLLHEMHRRRVGRILYLAEPEAAAPTAPPISWQQFFWQRIRFASKGRHYAPGFTASLVAVYLMNLLLVTGAATTLVVGKLSWLGVTATLWVVKSLAEFIFLRHAATIFMEQSLLRYFFIASVLHPFYILLFGAIGQFLSFQWKGVRYQRRLRAAQTASAAQ
jgi:cellulose synthase/poly-beta-1,6-N-acetylglucosamine synthase-like glycosyltransferase